MDLPPFTGMSLLREKGAISLFAARDGRGRVLIVKTFDPTRAPSDPIGARRFRRETLIASTLSHPFLARCIGHGDNWIAFERLDGSLAEPVHRTRYQDLQHLRALLGGLAEVLAYIHGRGVVHGDLKPAHVMFRGEQAVLIDFGIASLVADDALAGAELAGTPAWMSPEQVAGQPPRPCSDIWSLCAIGTWLLTGTPPVAGPAEDVLAAREAGTALPFDPSGERRRDPELVDLLNAGLGEMERRPGAAEIASQLSVRK